MVQSMTASTDLAATASFVPAKEVVDELLASPLPRAARAAMTALSVETLLPTPGTGVLAWPYSWSPFLCLFGFKEWTGPVDAFPAWGGVSIKAQDGSESHTSAAGVWQDEEGTYAGIVAKTGRPGFAPQDQIANNWVLAVRDFGIRTGGGDLLATLEAGDLGRISLALVATWPEGADANFPVRYTAALALFPADGDPVPSPVPVPPPPPPASPPLGTKPIEILLGDQCAIPVTAALDHNGVPVAIIPTGLLQPDDASICTAAISGETLTIYTRSVGSTVLRGADQAIPISVIPQVVTHLVLDFAHAVYSPMSAAAKAAIARLPMLAMVAALMLPVLRAGSPEPPPPIPLVPAAIETSESYAGPAWRFGQGELGRLTVECRLHDGAWLPCR